MKYLTLLALLALASITYAQDGADFPDMRSWQLSNSDTTERYIFADTALIRLSPDTKQAPIDTLFAGDNIVVTGITSKGLTIRGIRGPWLNIKYTKNGEPRTGYIWQGLVGLMPLRRGDVKFVYGIERRADSVYGSGKNKDTLKRFQVKLKAVQNGKVLAKASLITYDDESANFSSGKIMSGMGLTNVQNMIMLEFSGEACGIPTYDYYWAFTKSNQFVRFPDKESIADAGAFFHSENFIFPNEKNGKPDLVTWESKTEEDTGKTDKKGNPVYKLTEKKGATYTWDGVNEKISGSARK